MEKEIRVAVIDMNNGSPNQGMRGILGVLSAYRAEHRLNLIYEVFNLRVKEEIPGIGFDIYIASGGPGDPLASEHERWDILFFELLEEIKTYNSHQPDKKYVFLICHSFQLACRRYGPGKISRRKSGSFGIFPISLTTQGENDTIYNGLHNPFYAVDSRSWQVLEEKNEVRNETSPLILAMEKERPHVHLEPCIMSVRFSREFIGTQFHPEADPVGMKLYLLDNEKKAAIIRDHGEEKYTDMLQSLENPDRILRTRQTILPNFLDEAIQSLK